MKSSWVIWFKYIFFCYHSPSIFQPLPASKIWSTCIQKTNDFGCSWLTTFQELTVGGNPWQFTSFCGREVWWPRPNIEFAWPTAGHPPHATQAGGILLTCPYRGELSEWTWTPNPLLHPPLFICPSTFPFCQACSNFGHCPGVGMLLINKYIYLSINNAQTRQFMVIFL